MADYQHIAVSTLSGSAGYILVVEALDRQIEDFRTVGEVFRELTDLLKNQTTRKVVLDLTHVSYLSSTALNRLIDLDNEITAAGGRLNLCGLSPEIVEIFEITRLDQRFRIAKTQAEALASF